MSSGNYAQNMYRGDSEVVTMAAVPRVSYVERRINIIPKQDG